MIFQCRLKTTQVALNLLKQETVIAVIAVDMLTQIKDQLQKFLITGRTVGAVIQGGNGFTKQLGLTGQGQLGQ